RRHGCHLRSSLAPRSQNSRRNGALGYAAGVTRSVALAAGVLLCASCESPKGQEGGLPSSSATAAPTGTRIEIGDVSVPAVSILAAGTAGESAWRVTVSAT